VKFVFWFFQGPAKAHPMKIRHSQIRLFDGMIGPPNYELRMTSDELRATNFYSPFVIRDYQRN